MRHGRKINHLGRTASHRKALLSNMASSLILNKRINTTVAKAKELRKYIEPLITRSKLDTTHSRRMVFSYLNNKESVKILFNEVADRIMDRPGGYTRIIKTGQRLGDNAEMCMMELVDFNDLYTKDTGEKKAKTRRSRRSRSKKSEDVHTDAAATAEVTEVAEKEDEKTDVKAAEEKKTVKTQEKAKHEKKEAGSSKKSKPDKPKAKASDKKISSGKEKKDKGSKKGKK